ncbi:hypothetical protein FIBSPDRAFT_789699 [Athelia psychrophila]|uniref:DUF4470 domain-containing protein n=1 Tax=Athelia psychrophila TaxID=1759441 RepID=A0A166IZ93_9AGAM|nr:hypothetical protein FIBSPDRAFT_789699 [Fibularhizoctonia sp. CBS 109695]
MKEAIDCYSKAENEAPNDPVYPSHLSAAFYENGDYAGCVDAIFRSWKILKNNPALSFKLSARLAKSLAHGVRDGSITPSFIKGNAQVISELENITHNHADTACDTLQEHNRLWSEWTNISAEQGDRMQSAREALGRLSRLPVFKSSPEPDLTYHKWGTDDVISLFDGWGPNYDFPLEVKDLSEEELSKISFLFGGVGDARHAFGTIIGAHRAFKTLGKHRRSALQIHLTLLDLHPNILARDLCIMMLLHALMNQVEDAPPTERLEIKTTIFYTYIGVVLPGYCFERLCHTIRDLKRRLQKTPFILPDWIHVDSSSAVRITQVLDLWLDLVGKKDVASMLQVHRPESTASTSDIINHPSVSSESRQAILDSMESNRRKAYGHMEGEHEWYQSVKVFVPPADLWNRHPGFAKFLDLKTGQSKLTAKEKISLTTHIEHTWGPNLTLFDKRNTMLTTETSPYPYLDLDIFKSPRQIEVFNYTYKLSRRDPQSVPDAPAYSHVSTFFGGVLDALLAMKGKFKIEIIYGELTAELSKWRFGDDTGRPVEFPTEFTRAWLSNVPDYTHGLINTCVYRLPCIQLGEKSAVASNCLLNTGIFKNDEEFCHTYTLVDPRDVPRYLGCKLLCNDTRGVQVATPLSLPRPASELADRKELLTWLTRIFLCTIFPGAAAEGSFSARLPNNLVAFIGLLVHLKHVGFPAHWLSELLQNIISDNLTTDIAPYSGIWPIPITEIHRRVLKRKVRLDPWLAELEAILASTLHGLPFAISLPLNFSQSSAEIGLFETNVLEEGWHVDFRASEPTLNLIFYKPSSSWIPWNRSIDTLLASIRAAFEGNESVAQGSFFILTAIEAFDRRGVVRWRLSRERVQRMKANNWSMVAYRTDSKELVIKPSPASSWVDVGPASAQPATLAFLEILDVD